MFEELKKYADVELAELDGFSLKGYDIFIGKKMSEETLAEESFGRCSVDADVSLGNGCRVQIHAGPGLVKKSGAPSKEVHFILDNDFYMPGNIPVNYSAGALQTLHNKTFPVFRGAVTELLHNAMEPDTL